MVSIVSIVRIPVVFLCAAISMSAIADCPGAQWPAPYEAYRSYCKLQGDFNNDGIPDIVFVGDTVVFTHMGGNPSIQSRVFALTYLSATYQGYAVQLGDSTGDGIPDLVFNGPSVSFRFAGRSDGTFNPIVTNPYDAYAIGYRRVQADFNKDGVADIVFVGDSLVFTHMGGNPNFPTRILALTFPSATYQGYAAQLGDSTGDGIPDLVFNGPSVSFRFAGRLDGTFNPTVTNPYDAYVVGYRRLQGDFNGDGVLDIVFVGDSLVFTHMGGNPNFQTRVLALTYPSATYQGYNAQLSEINSDGIPDLVFTGPSFTQTYNGRHDGRFMPDTRLLVVEYRNTIDFPSSPGGHFFYSSDVAEQAAVDAGTAGAFVRTGRSFLLGGTSPVCRFYGSVTPGPNSHFFTVDVGECNALKAAQIMPRPATVQQWNYEGISYTTTPAIDVASGARSCPENTNPLYRAYNNAFPLSGPKNPWDSNHRFTPQRPDIAAMVANGWRDEGIVFCTLQ